jgi:hypothetical protein
MFALTGVPRGLRPACASSHGRGIPDDRILRQQVLTILRDVVVFDAYV